MISSPIRPHEAGIPIDARWTGLAIGLIAFATLTPRPEWSLGPHWLGFHIPTNGRGWLDVFANILLYMPLGIALAGRGASTLRTCLAALACSLVTEGCQSVIPGRAPSGTDVVSNVMGACLGCIVIDADAGGRIRRSLASLSRLIDRLLAPEPPLAARSSLVWSAVITTVFCLTAVVLGSWLPAPPYVVAGPVLDPQPGPFHIGSSGVPGDFFAGVIDDVRVYDRALPQEAVRADMRRSVAATPGETHLLAAYAFDEGAGRIASDRSPHRRDGDVRDAVWTADGRFGGALFFNGRSSEVVVPAGDGDLRDSMTLEAWVRPLDNRGGAAPAPIPGNENPWSTVIARDGNVFLHASTATEPLRPAGGGWFGSMFEAARAASPIAAGVWTHLALTYDSQTVRLYVNGELQSSTVHWSPHRALVAELAGSPLPLHGNRHVDVRTRLLDDLDLHITLDCGAPSSVRAPMFLIATTYNTPILRLDADGEDVWIRSSTWGSRLGLPTPDQRVPGALRRCTPGQTLDLTMTGTLRHPHLTTGPLASRGVGANPASGWALLVYSSMLPLWLQRASAGAWLGLLFLPFGFWARRAGPTAAAVFVLGATLIALFHYWPPADFDPVQLLAAPSGIAAGLLSRRAMTFVTGTPGFPLT